MYLRVYTVSVESMLLTLCPYCRLDLSTVHLNQQQMNIKVNEGCQITRKPLARHNELPLESSVFTTKATGVNGAIQTTIVSHITAMQIEDKISVM